MYIDKILYDIKRFKFCLDWTVVFQQSTILLAPISGDFSDDIRDVIDFNSYQLYAQEYMAIKLEDDEPEVPPVSADVTCHILNLEMDLLSW